MRTLQLLAALLLVAVLAMTSAFAATNTTCPNQAVSKSSNFKDVPFQYVEATLNNNVCPSLNGKPSCCPDNVIRAVQLQFDLARLDVLKAKAVMDAVRLQSAGLNTQFDRVRSDIDSKQANGDITATQADALRKFVNSVQTALTNFIDRVTTSFIRCLESILTYLAGVVCFGCDVNWQNYTVYYGTNNTIRVVINQKTCDSMNGGCIDYYLSFVQLVVDLTNAVADLRRDLGLGGNVGTVKFYANPCYNGTLYNDTTTNGQKCKDFICRNLVHGADVSNPEAETDNNVGSRDLDAKHASHLLRTSFDHMHATAGDAFAQVVLDNALSVIENARSAHELSTRALRDTTANQQTTYSSNGVDLYAMGEASGLNKSASASMLTVATFLFGLIAAAAVLF